MSKNPYEPPSTDLDQQRLLSRIGDMDDTDEVDVFYCDSDRFDSRLRTKFFTDRGSLGYCSNGGADFYGMKVTLRGIRCESIRLRRPPFAVGAFLFGIIPLGAYATLVFLPGKNSIAAWFMGMVIGLLFVLVVRLFTASWLEVTVNHDGDKKRHYFFIAEQFGWNGLLFGCKRLRAYFDLA